MDLPREPVGPHLERGDEIEPEQREVRVIVAGERLVLQMGVHEAQAAEPALPRATAAHVRQLELARVPDDHGVDVPLAIEEDADLPVGLRRDLAQVPGELGARRSSRRRRGVGTCGGGRGAARA